MSGSKAIVEKINAFINGFIVNVCSGKAKEIDLTAAKATIIEIIDLMSTGKMRPCFGSAVTSKQFIAAFSDDVDGASEAGEASEQSNLRYLSELTLSSYLVKSLASGESTVVDSFINNTVPKAGTLARDFRLQHATLLKCCILLKALIDENSKAAVLKELFVELQQHLQTVEKNFLFNRKIKLNVEYNYSELTPIIEKIGSEIIPELS